MEFKISNPNKIIDSEDFAKKTGASFFSLDGEFYVGNVESLQEANELIANYIYIEPPLPTVTDKLALVGLSLDELKAAILGGN